MRRSAIAQDDMTTLLERKAPPGSALPILLAAAPVGAPLPMSGSARELVEEALRTVGGALLRGFDVPSVDAFRAFATSFGHPLLKYEFASTPRSAVPTASGAGVYTSTEYPAHQAIPLHNEQAYTREWPMKIWFHCVVPPLDGGETPIADSRAVYRRMPAAIRERLEPGVRYVRNYGDFDIPWRQAFDTDDRAAVEAFCRRAGVEWQWGEGDTLRTEQLCRAVETHPVTGEKVWFNQAHLFHVSNLQPEVREALEDVLGAENMPRNVYDADGKPLEDELLDEVRRVLDAETVSFPWREGDVLALDNMLVAHARAPFKGPRKVVVAMAEPHGNREYFQARSATFP
jgi:alpha-ketoglutarate-dependent taurine dioxygenase